MDSPRLNHAEAGRLGGAATVAAHGSAHMRAIAKGAKRGRPKLRTWDEIMGDPSGRRAARAIEARVKGGQRQTEEPRAAGASGGSHVPIPDRQKGTGQ